MNIMRKTDRKEELTSLSREIQSLSREMQNDALFSVLTLSRIITYQYRKTEKENDLSQVKIEILETLVLNDGCLTSTLIGKEVFRTKYTISRTIQQLEKDGLVLMEQRPTEEDKRFKRVHITTKGIDLVRSQLPQRVSFARELSALLTPEEVSMLNSLCRKFITQLLNKMGNNTYIRL